MARTEEHLRWELYFALEKVRTRRGSLLNFRRLMSQNKPRLKSASNAYLKLMVDRLKSGLKDLKGRKASAMARDLIDWDVLKEEGARIFKPSLLKVLGKAGEATVRQLVRKQEGRFDVIGVAAVKWAEKHAAKLVRQITNESMQAIRAYIARGVNAGKAVSEIARELRPLVGLTENQIMAVANYQERLIVNRPEYTASRIEEATEAYARKMHRARANLIAFDQTRAALWEGQFEGYGQMGIDKVEGVSGVDACEWCQENINGQVYTLEEARALDTHPGCGCAWVTAV